VGDNARETTLKLRHLCEKFGLHKTLFSAYASILNFTELSKKTIRNNQRINGKLQKLPSLARISDTIAPCSDLLAKLLLSGR